MSVFSSLFPKPKPVSSPIAKAIKLMRSFVDCALLLVPQSRYEDPRMKEAIWAFVMGVCDGCTQLHGLGVNESVEVFASFVGGGLPHLSLADQQGVASSFAMHVKNNPVLEPYFDAGGASLFEWRENKNAPLALSKMLIEMDHSMEM